MADEIRITAPTVYSDDRRGWLKLYLYRRDGKHTGAIWFRKGGLPADVNQVLPQEARVAALQAVPTGLEVMVTNGSDFAVFHAKNGSVIYPKTAEDVKRFWDEVAPVAEVRQQHEQAAGSGQGM